MSPGAPLACWRVFCAVAIVHRILASGSLLDFLTNSGAAGGVTSYTELGRDMKIALSSLFLQPCAIKILECARDSRISPKQKPSLSQSLFTARPRELTNFVTLHFHFKEIAFRGHCHISRHVTSSVHTAYSYISVSRVAYKCIYLWEVFHQEGSEKNGKAVSTQTAQCLPSGDISG